MIKNRFQIHGFAPSEFILIALFRHLYVLHTHYILHAPLHNAWVPREILGLLLFNKLENNLIILIERTSYDRR